MTSGVRDNCLTDDLACRKLCTGEVSLVCLLQRLGHAFEHHHHRPDDLSELESTRMPSIRSRTSISLVSGSKMVRSRVFGLYWEFFMLIRTACTFATYVAP